MIAPLSAEILALSTADRARLAARLIEADEVPLFPLLILETVLMELMQRCLDLDTTWTEATH